MQHTYTEDDTFLHRVAFEGDIASCKKICRRRNVNFNQPNKKLDTPMHFAAKQGHVSIVRMLLRKKASMYSKNSNQETPYYLAIIHDHVSVIKTMIRFGLKLADEFQYIMYDLVLKNKLEMFKLIFGHIIVPSSMRASLLHHAIYLAQPDFVELMVEKQMDVDLLNFCGQTALSIAVELRSYTITKILVDKATKDTLTKIDKNGYTPLQVALLASLSDIVTLLYHAWATIPGYCSSLHWACENGKVSLEMLNLLVSLGEDVNAIDLFGNSALHCASDVDRVDIMFAFMQNRFIVPGPGLDQMDL